MFADIYYYSLIAVPSSPRNVKLDSNSTFDDINIHWDPPDLPSGRHVFYVVALRQSKSVEAVYERVSIVRGQSCTLKFPECPSPKLSYTVEVRAVNVGESNEIDTEIKPMNRNIILGGAEIDQSFCISNNVEKEMFLADDTKSYFASSWINSMHTHTCSNNTNAATIYAVAFIIVIIFASYMCCWIRNKYYKMKNIKVILPDGLVEVPNYKFASNGLSNDGVLESSSKKDKSRSNDCLVSPEHKGNQILISNIRNRSSNALSSLSSSCSSSKDHRNDDQLGEHPSLETTNEELSSNSSSSSHSNLTYHNHHHVQMLSGKDTQNSVAVERCNAADEDDKDNTNDYNEQYHNLNITQDIKDDGYVTHNTQLLASILNTVPERPVPPSFSTSFPAMTPDGYIQPSAAKQLVSYFFVGQPKVCIHNEVQKMSGTFARNPKLLIDHQHWSTL